MICENCDGVGRYALTGWRRHLPWVQIVVCEVCGGLGTI